MNDAQQWKQWAMSRRRFIGTSAAAAAMISIAETGVSPFGARVARAQEGEPKMGGSITMSLADDDVQSFDPIPVYDNMSIWTMLLIYDQLIRVAPDGLSLEPGLATEWSASEDGLTYTFALRDAMFHDGTPCKASDVAFCLNRAAFGESSSWAFIFSAIDKIEAPDDKTVVITLKSVWVPLEADLALFGASVFPQAAYEAQGEELWQAPIGTGAFMFDSWEKGARVILKKNPNYWDGPKPYLDELYFEVLTDANARMLQFQSGELDIATDVPFNQLDPIRQNPDFVVLQDAVARIDYIGFNVTKEPLTDKKVRQAINYAVDKDAIIQNVLFGAGEMATSFLPKMAGRDPNSPGYPFDLEKAKALIAESGYKDGFEFELLVNTGDPVASQIAQLVAAQVSAIGGTVTITQLEPGINQERQVAGDYQAAKGYFTTDIIDPDELASFAVLSDGGTNAIFTFYDNPDVDQLIKDAQVETDPAKRQELYNQIQALHLDDAPFLFLFYPTGRTATQGYVKNFHILPTGNYRLYETWRDDV